MKNILITFLLVLVSPGFVFADMEDLGASEKTQAILSAGYNWVETEDASGRAAEYMYQDVSGTASFEIKGGINDKHFIVDGKYLNENDYAFNAHFDRNNAQKLDLRFEKLFHNLDHIDYNSRPDAEFTNTLVPSQILRANFSDANAADEYSLKVSTNEANLRAKLPDMASHINIGYWQFQKEGEKQMRFADEGCNTQCHVQSKTRELDRTTHQISGGFDVHLGRTDLIMKHTYRELVIDDPIPTDDFQNHFRLRPGTPGTLREFQHSVDPESQMHESTLELHSSLAGGVNLAASGTFGKRKNNSQATGASPIVAEIDYFKGAADVTHTTSSKFSYNFKARYLELDNENTYPDLLDPFVFDGLGGLDPGGLVDVRPSIDIDRASYELIASYRPHKKMTWKGNLKVEQIKRSETGGVSPFHSSSGGTFVNDTVWELPDEEIITTAKVSFFARPMAVSTFKVNGFYKFQNSDEPAYGASFDDSHQLFLSTTYAINPQWGMNASARATLDTLDNHVHEVIFDEGPPLVINEVPRDREREQESVNIGTWYTPIPNVTTTLNYGYNRTAITQDLMYGMSPNNAVTGSAIDYIIMAKDAEFLQEVHSVNGSVAVALLGNVKATVYGYYTRSLANYDPVFATQSFLYRSGPTNLQADASSDGLKDISQYDIDQFGAKAAVDYYFTPDFELTLNYSYDEYNEKYTNDFDGSVQTAMANLAYRF